MNFFLYNDLYIIPLGVDVVRFAEDPVYKTDTILGLAMFVLTFCSLLYNI